MANYKLSQEAKADLRNIYRYGARKHGNKQADKYYDALHLIFQQIAGYRRSVCGMDAIY